MANQLFFVALSISCVLSNHIDTDRIIGGQDAIPGTFPYQVSIQQYVIIVYMHTCGGSIISPLWVLTAAHCCEDSYYYQIVAGITELYKNTPNRQERNVAKFITHPNYTGKATNYTNDIAVIQLDSPFEFNKFINTIRLPEPGDVPDGVAVISGWGSTKNEGLSIPTNLKSLQVPITSPEVCKEHYLEHSEDRQFCAGTLDKGVCFGDSGGPLVKNGHVIGIVSYGYVPCASGHPAIFTKVSSYIDFILENVH